MERPRLRRLWVVAAALTGFVVVGAGGALAAGLAGSVWAVPAAAGAAAVAAFAPVWVGALQERSRRRAERELTWRRATAPAAGLPSPAAGPAGATPAGTRRRGVHRPPG